MSRSSFCAIDTVQNYVYADKYEQRVRVPTTVLEDILRHLREIASIRKKIMTFDRVSADRVTTEHRGTNYEGQEIEDTEDGRELKDELHENPVT